MNKHLAAQRLRQTLERRIAQVLECKPNELPRMKLGTLVHFLFLLVGDAETLGGFHTTMAALLNLLGNEIVWDIEPKEERDESAPTEIIN
jgi:hypothetical protein